MKNFYLLLILICFPAFISAQNETRQKYYIEDVSSLNLDNYKGNINIQTWDMAGAEISIRIYCDDDDNDCERKVSRTRVKIDSSSPHLKIETDYSKIKDNDSWLNVSGWFGGEVLPCVDYTIKMPAKSPLNIDDYKSTISVADMSSPIKIETYKGKVKLERISGPVDFESYKGKSEFSFTNLTGNNSFDTYKGDIILYVPENTKASFEDDFTKRTDFESDIPFMDPKDSAAKIRFESYKGSMSIKKSRQ